ncbi:MAG: alpha/beta hydrolase [Dehalococcoidia bacterium]|nr:MAG: alpha/beta hydrolase [Dehalococcoidia bacterium]
MPTVDSGGVTISYVAEGSGPAVVLVHGFASSVQGNWRGPGIIDALVAAGRRVVAIDCRGHGASGKPHDPESYSGTAMVDDVLAVMDAEGVERADLIGYSMGGAIAASLLVGHPGRFGRVILAGVGDTLATGGRGRRASEAIASALESETRAGINDARARAFRSFAEQQGNDMAALAAIQRSTREFDRGKLGEVRNPVMVLIGEGDALVGPADQLAAAIPGAQLVKVPGDHLTAVVKPEFRAAIVAFLSEAAAR